MRYNFRSVAEDCKAVKYPELSCRSECRVVCRCPGKLFVLQNWYCFWDLRRLLLSPVGKHKLCFNSLKAYGRKLFPSQYRRGAAWRQKSCAIPGLRQKIRSLWRAAFQFYAPGGERLHERQGHQEYFCQRQIEFGWCLGTLSYLGADYGLDRQPNRPAVYA